MGIQQLFLALVSAVYKAFLNIAYTAGCTATEPGGLYQRGTRVFSCAAACSFIHQIVGGLYRVNLCSFKLDGVYSYGWQLYVATKNTMVYDTQQQSTEHIVASIANVSTFRPYIIRLDATGITQQIAFNTTWMSGVPVILLDGQDNVYVASFTPAITTLLGKYTPTLTNSWWKLITAQGGAGAWARASSIAGNYIALGVIDRSGTHYKPVVCLFNTSGTLLWQKTLTETTYTSAGYIYGIAVNAVGDVVCILYSNAVIYAIKFNSAGATIWVKTLAYISSNYYQCGSCCDSDGNFWIAIFYNDTTYLLKFAADGSSLLQRSLNFNGSLSYNAVMGKITVAGQKNDSGGVGGAVAIHLALDGSGTGTYNLGNYSIVYGTNTITSMSAGSVSPINGSLVVSNTTAVMDTADLLSASVSLTNLSQLSP